MELAEGEKMLRLPLISNFDTNGRNKENGYENSHRGLLYSENYQSKQSTSSPQTTLAVNRLQINIKAFWDS